MATLTLTPPSGTNKMSVGSKGVLTGVGFTSAATVTVTCLETGAAVALTADAGGTISSDRFAAHAGAKLTATGNAVAAETVTVGAVTYTWRASVSTTANEVLVGANAAESLRNLKAAINLDTSFGAVYGSLTVVHPTVGAGELTATTLQLYALTGGTGGNSLASTETMTNASFANTTFQSGAAAGSVDPLLILPQSAMPFTLSATDGTNTATLRTQVWTS